MLKRFTAHLLLVSIALFALSFTKTIEPGKMTERTISKKIPAIIFPVIYFKKNSTEFRDQVREGDTLKTEILLESLKSIFAKEKGLVIQCAGNCSADEDNVTALSRQRAEKVRKALIKMGIHPKRLQVKGFGAKNQKKNDVKDPAEKEKLLAQDRWCVFTILNWDFKE